MTRPEQLKGTLFHDPGANGATDNAPESETRPGPGGPPVPEARRRHDAAADRAGHVPLRPRRQIDLLTEARLDDPQRAFIMRLLAVCTLPRLGIESSRRQRSMRCGAVVRVDAWVKALLGVGLDPETPSGTSRGGPDVGVSVSGFWFGCRRLTASRCRRSAS